MYVPRKNLHKNKKLVCKELRKKRTRNEKISVHYKRTEQ